MSERGTRETVKELYDAYGRGDVERLTTLLYEDIDWVIYGPIEIFSFAGSRHGRTSVLRVIGEIAEAYSLEDYTTEVVVVEGDRAAVMSDVSFKQLATGRTIRFRVANFLRIQNGQLIEFREFSDSFDLVEQAIGHAVEL